MSGLALALTGAASVAALTAARPGPLDPTPSTHTFATAVEAVQAALAGSTGGVVAFGELHQTRDTAGIPSALKRFETDILPAVADRLSHLVIETWVTTGRCGEAEKAVTADVEKTTQRPASTESEIETLIRIARERGITPRILSISCADYEAMRPAGGGINYDRTLRVTARALEGAIVRAVGEAGGRSGGAPSSEGPRMVAVYGGALHNDLVPDPELAAYSFAPRVLAATLGRFLEIDLVVPEYATGSSVTQAQPWWRAYRRARAGRRAAVLIRRSARSYVVVFPFHVAPAARGESPHDHGSPR
jgi:hypothetical protein